MSLLHSSPLSSWFVSLSFLLCLPLFFPHHLLRSCHPIYPERAISSNMSLIINNWKENYLLTNTSSLVTIRLFQSLVMATHTTLPGYIVSYPSWLLLQYCQSATWLGAPFPCHYTCCERCKNMQGKLSEHWRCKLWKGRKVNTFWQCFSSKNMLLEVFAPSNITTATHPPAPRSTNSTVANAVLQRQQKQSWVSWCADWC